MKENFRDLNDLLCRNDEAKEFYLRQPEDVQGWMQQNTQAIQSLELMRSFLEVK